MKQLLLKTVFIGLVLLLCGVHQVSAALIPDRAALDDILGVDAVTEDFEALDFMGVPNQNVFGVLDSHSIVLGQGPGLIVEGVLFSSSNSLVQWNSDGYFGLSSQTLASGNTPDLVIKFADPVRGFGVDVVSFPTAPSQDTIVRVFGSDDTTLLTEIFISPNMNDFSFVGYENMSGIGRVEVIKSDGTSAPSIDNLTFGGQDKVSNGLVAYWSFDNCDATDDITAHWYW